MFKGAVKKYLCGVAMVILSIVMFGAPVNAQTEYNFTAAYDLPGGKRHTVNILSKQVSFDAKFDRAAAAQAFKNGADQIYAIPEKTVTEYTVVLPQNCKEIVLEFNHSEKTYIDGKEISSGEKITFDREKYTLTVGLTDYSLNVKYASAIPQIYVEIADDGLEKIHADKDHRESGEITIVNGDKLEYSGMLSYIKGRGNGSWRNTKKPYAIKLASNAKIFGMEKSKKYVLIADHYDLTVVRGKTGLDLATNFGIPYCSQSQPVDLYINGNYAGLYLLAEKVEVDEGRIDIFNLDIINERANPGVDLADCQTGMIDNGGDSANRNPGTRKWVEMPNDMTGEITGGYLIEMELGDRFDENASAFVTNYGQTVVVKSPEYASKSQLNYIADYYQQFEDALTSDSGYNSQGYYYTEYIDLDSFVKAYVFQEYVKNVDAAITSCYIYKNVNGKLTACSQWDMDMTFGEDLVRRRIDFTNPGDIWVADGKIFNSKTQRSIFALLCRHPDFRREASRQWSELLSGIAEKQIYETETLLTEIKNSAAADRYLWNKYLSYGRAEKMYAEMSDEMLSFMTDRKEYINDIFDESYLYVAYRHNGGKGPTQDKNIYKPGDIAVVLENEYTNDGKAFIGWNTQPDGSGTSYNSGDEITMTEDVYLYAQWDGGNAELQEQPQPQQQSVGFLARLIAWFKKLF